MGKHYIPRKYLKRFVETNSDNELFRIDLKTLTAKKLPIASIAQEKEIYSDELENYLTYKIENPSHLVFDKLISKTPISQKEKYLISKFIVSLYKRVPEKRAEITNKYDDVYQKHFDHLFVELEKSLDLYPEKKEIITKNMKRIKELKNSPSLYNQIWQKIIPPETTPGLPVAIYNMNWHLFEIESHNLFFVTSDNPIWFDTKIGIGHPFSELTMPLSNKLALLICWQKSDYLYKKATKENVSNFNYRSISKARNSIFSPKYEDWIIKYLTIQKRIKMLVDRKKIDVALYESTKKLLLKTLTSV